ncbi:YihY/virulence factor BrkB family protein [Microbacterium sp. ARD31]|uniref:YihY/virulence factor BrkB family protein n=1 Tax=Microbacterium sp. ARD31 TaxID=2962576 RepID=UPI002882582E|nr:YihY/virulence factor BrkB family protein [Microbacterium sp. ARD31]MDT0184089.1 YihY/virulence factor BrkB family protein [Microbacterium sp. ARD31]
MPAIIAKIIARVLTFKVVRAFLLYSERRGPMLADSVTYRALFSIFAGVLLGFSFAALWLAGNPAAFQSLIASVDAVIPGLVGEGGLIDPSDIQAPAGLTVTGILATVGLVLAAIGAIGSMRMAMRSIAATPNDDILFIWVILRNLALAIGIGLALGASAVITFLATFGVSILADWFGMPQDSPLVAVLTGVIGVIVVFILDAAAIAVLFVVLAGVKPPARALWTGALLGAFGLTVLQQLSGLFVGGAGSNPLLASFASLIALLLWVNLSSQVILIATAYIVVGIDESRDRVRAKYGASTFLQRRVRQAEVAVQLATDELRRARELEEEERTRA